MTRRIDLNTLILPDPQRYAWLEANGIDPNTVPAAQEALVEDGKLTVVVFAQKDGHKVQDPTTSEHRWLKELRTVPLLSAPEDHNL